MELDATKVKKLIFIRDYIDDRGNEHRELKVGSDEIFTHSKKLQFTSWPQPSINMEILYKEHQYEGGEVTYREIFTEYWEKDEFTLNQQLALSFYADYFSYTSNTIHRVLIDEKGRKYNIDLQNSKASDEIKQGTISNFTVRGINAENNYPMIDFGFNAEEFEIGQKVSLEITKEIDNSTPCRLAKDLLGRIHMIPRLPFQVGDKYTPIKIGEHVEYEVEDINEYHKPLFIEPQINNPYFIQISKLSSEAQEYYHELKLISKVKDLSLKEQFESGDANWIFSFLNILIDEQFDLINNSDFAQIIKLSKVILEINKYILSSGFLLSYYPIKRNNLSIIVKKSIERTEPLIEIVGKILNPKEFNKLLDGLTNSKIDNLVDKNKSDQLKLDIYLLLKYFDSATPNSIVEDIINKSDGLVDLRVNINKLLWTRKKRIRGILFREEVDDPTQKINLKNNQELEHLIFLSKFDLSTQINDAHILIGKLNILRFEAYYLDSIEKIHECDNLFLEKLNIKKLLPIKEDFDNFWENHNFALAQNYRFLAKHSELITETIANYKQAATYYAKLGSLQKYIVTGLIKYFELLDLIENSNSLEKIRDKAKSEYKFYSQPDTRSKSEKMKFLKQLIDMWHIVSMIGSNSTKNMEDLFNYAVHKYSINNEGFDQLYNGKIASLILASNLIEVDKNELLYNQLSEVFKEGAINLKNLSGNSIDKDSDEYKQDKLFGVVSNDESPTIEFKGSWDLDIDSYIKEDPHAEIIYNQDMQVIKGVAAFLNANLGGKLYIGVLEKKPKYRKKFNNEQILKKFKSLDVNKNILLGVEKELQHSGKSADDLIQIITEKIRIQINEKASKYISIQSVIYSEKTLIEITIAKNSFEPEGWWISYNNKYVLPHRENTRVYMPEGREALEWLKDVSMSIGKKNN